MVESLAFYASPGRFTTLLDGDATSGGIEQIVDVVQGLLVPGMLEDHWVAECWDADLG